MIQGQVNRNRRLEVPLSIKVSAEAIIEPVPADAYRITAIKSGTTKTLMSYTANTTQGPVTDAVLSVSATGANENACNAYFRMDGSSLIANVPAGVPETRCRLLITVTNAPVALKSTLEVTVYPNELPFMKWCNGNLSAEDQNTVDTIRSSLAKNNCGITVWPTITRTCEADALILSRTIQLCLGEYGLTSLAPLASIPSLERLEAFNNKIVDVSSLAKLPALRFVYLSGNKITDPNTLVQLPKLRWLGLSNNPLSQQASIDALARKEGMFYLGLRQTERGCPADRKVAICTTKGNDETLATTISTWPPPQDFYYYHAKDGAHDDSVFFTVDGLYPQTLAEGDHLRIPGTVVIIRQSGPDTFKVSRYWDVEGQY